MFCALNFLSAFLPMLGKEPIANARPGSFADLFFFSVETISTTGYGDMHPAFAPSWTLFHRIDADSPPCCKTSDEAIAEDIKIVVSISGLDETSSQTVNSRYTYAAEDLRWDHEFIDMLHRDELGQSHIDFSKVHDIKPYVT